MPERIPQSVAIRVPIEAFLAVDHVTPATGKVISVTISKNGAAYGNPAAGATNATETGSGSYYVDLSATDTNTTGPLYVKFSEASIDTGKIHYTVVNAHNAGFDGIPAVAIGSAGALPTWVSSSPSAGQVVQDAPGRLNISVDAVDGTNAYAFDGLIASITPTTITFPSTGSSGAPIDDDGTYGAYSWVDFPEVNESVITGGPTGTLNQYSILFGTTTRVVNGVTGYVRRGTIQSKLGNTAHGGAAAVLQLERLLATSTTTDEPAAKFTGNGAGAGIETFSVSGPGFYPHSTTNIGLYARSSNGIGQKAEGGGTSGGLVATGGTGGGHGLVATRGTSGADDVFLTNSDAPTLDAAITGAGFAAATHAATADKLLGRNLAGGSDGGRTVMDALRASRNKVAFDVPATGQFTVYAEDDVTPAWTGTYARSATPVNALTAVDPV